MRLLLFSFIYSSVCLANQLNWDNLSTREQYEFLYDLEYTSEEDLPAQTRVLDLLKEEKLSKLLQDYKKHSLELLDAELDRESIEQSPYSPYGEEEVTDFLVLMQGEKILGAYVYIYQDGRDQDGEDSDVNWGASVRLNSEGQFFTDDNGIILDDLRFEWTGH